MDKKILNRVGFRYGITTLLFLGLQLLIVALLSAFLPVFVSSRPALASYISLVAGFYLITFPLLILMLRKIPAVAPERDKLGFGGFVKGILTAAGICLVGSVIGALVQSLIISLSGSEPAGIADLMLSGDNWANILTAGVLAPIFEELIFRKLLLDRVAPKYGSTLAILLSGLMFGLFHGNFQQLFFAAGLGFFFAYIYLRTGNILITIAYHMIINLSTSGVTVVLMKRALEDPVMQGLLEGTLTDFSRVTSVSGATLGYFGWTLFLGLFAFAGLVVLLLEVNGWQKKRKVMRKELEAAEAAAPADSALAPEAQSVPAASWEEYSVRGALKRIFASIGVWFFILTALVLFVFNYM